VELVIGPGDRKEDVHIQQQQVRRGFPSSITRWIREAGITGAFAGTSNTGKRRDDPRVGESAGFRPRRASVESTFPRRSPDARESERGDLAGGRGAWIRNAMA
jgi:hypothetical protein